MRRPAARRRRGLEARKEAGHCRRAAPRSSRDGCTRPARASRKQPALMERRYEPLAGNRHGILHRTRFSNRPIAPPRNSTPSRPALPPASRRRLECIAADAVLSCRSRHHRVGPRLHSSYGCRPAGRDARARHARPPRRRPRFLDLAPTVATPNSTWAAVASVPGVLTPSSTKTLTTRLLTASMRFRSPTTLFAGARNIHPGDRKRHT